MKISVYGQSDDLIELDGGIYEEYGSYSHPSFLHFSDGTIIECEYCPEDDPQHYWRFKILKQGAGTAIQRVPGTYDGEDGHICDRLVIEGDIKFVRCFDSADGPTAELLVSEIEKFDGWCRLKSAQLRTIYDAIKLGDDS